jgi:hypothetical protein
MVDEFAAHDGGGGGEVEEFLGGAGEGVGGVGDEVGRRAGDECSGGRSAEQLCPGDGVEPQRFFRSARMAAPSWRASAMPATSGASCPRS